MVPFNVWLKRGANLNDYLLWRGIINAIPETWKLMLVSQEDVVSTIKTCKIEHKEIVTDVYSVTEKQIKEFFRKKAYDEIRDCDKKAKCKYDIRFDIQEKQTWNDIYILPFSILLDNKIIELQYKILHRIIPTKQLV